MTRVCGGATAVAPLPELFGAPVATAVVVTHNSQAYIAASLTSACQAGLAVRVVDNASVDRTLDIIDREFPDVMVMANPVNVGLAAAVNRAIPTVRTDIVLLVHPDCVVPPATAHELVRLLRDRPSIGIAGPRLIGPGGQAAVSAHAFQSLGGVLARRLGGNLIPVALRRLLCGAGQRRVYDACRKPAGPVEVDWVSGACLAVRTELLVGVGGLDERYFLHYEDEALCLRARTEGAKVAYLPTVEAYHVGGASGPDPVSSWPHLYRSMLLFFARHRAEQFPKVRAAVAVRALIGIVVAGTGLPLAPRSGAARLRAWRDIAGMALAARPGSPFSPLRRHPERSAAAPAPQKVQGHPSGGGSSSQRPDPARARPANRTAITS